MVNADNILKILNCFGINKWKKISESAYDQNHFRNNATKKQPDLKYLPLPQIEIHTFLNPDNRIFTGFRFVDMRGLKKMHGVRVFAMLDGRFIPVCGEFQQGCEEVLLDLPGGRLEPDEDPAVCAKREFEEESGIILKNVVCLGSRPDGLPTGMPIAARLLAARNFSFMGIIDNPPTVNGQNLDKNEYLKTVLISLEDWLKLIERELVQCYSASTTLLALRKLGKI